MRIAVVLPPPNAGVVKSHWKAALATLKLHKRLFGSRVTSIGPEGDVFVSCPSAPPATAAEEALRISSYYMRVLRELKRLRFDCVYFCQCHYVQLHIEAAAHATAYAGKVLCGLDGMWWYGKDMLNLDAILAASDFGVAFTGITQSSIDNAPSRAIPWAGVVPQIWDEPSSPQALEVRIRRRRSGISSLSYLLIVGRVSEEKGLPFVMQAAAASSYRIVWAGPLEIPIPKAIPQGLHFKGQVKEVFYLLAHSLASLHLPLQRFPWSIALVESISIGVPVIALRTRESEIIKSYLGDGMLLIDKVSEIDKAAGVAKTLSPLQVRRGLKSGVEKALEDVRKIYDAL